MPHLILDVKLVLEHLSFWHQLQELRVFKNWNIERPKMQQMNCRPQENTTSLMQQNECHQWEYNISKIPKYYGNEKYNTNTRS